MATAAQTVANRSNAQKSTGPRTPEGKAKVAQNAVKHGLLARAVVLQGEDPQEFAEYREQMLDELCPDGMLEEVLADRVVSLSWRLQRAARSQNAAFEALYDKYAAGGQTEPLAPEVSPSLDSGEPADHRATLGRMLVEDFGQEKVLERLLMYERRIESSLYRTMAELRKLRGQHGQAGHIPRAVEEDAVRDTHPIWGRAPAGGAPASCRGPERWEEGQKVRRSEAGSPFPPSVPAFSPSSGEEAPDGVTTHAAAQGQSCQTKPICAPRSTVAVALGETGPEGRGATVPRPPSVGPHCFPEEVGRGRPTSEEPTAGGVLSGRGMEANGWEEEADSAKQSQWAADRIGATLRGGTLSAAIS